MRATASESGLIGKEIDASLARTASRAVVSAAKSLSRNTYKVQVLEATIQRTVLDALK
jgi:CO/xanthine dehydrogenase FAD-binding subunit